MTYIRGDAAQFDAWEKDLGITGWNWDTMLKYYKKVESFLAPEEWQVDAGATYDPSFHTSEGDLHVGFIPDLINGSFYHHTEDGWDAAGLPKNKDANTGSTRGFDVFPQTIDSKLNKRWDAATAFFWPVDSDRENLKLYNGTAQKILWKKQSKCNSDARASGVEYKAANGETMQLMAKKEVILAAGALRSPLILENSGVGHAPLMKDNGIDAVVDLPGVGENLLDQPISFIAYQGNFEVKGYSSYSTFATAYDIFGNETDSIAQDSNKKIAEWAQQVVDGSRGALKSSSIEKLMRSQHDLIFSQNVTLGEAVLAVQGDIFASSHWELLPFSRGRIHIGSEGIENPKLDPRFLAADFDVTTQAAIAKLVRKFYTSKPMSEITGAQIEPSPEDVPPENATDEQLEAFVRGKAGSNNHPLGSAAMLPREMGGVVGPQLKVYGTANVRVVDASVIPTQISGHLTATIYAVAERAAEMILSDV
jgi:choline dehydrogenase